MPQLDIRNLSKAYEQEVAVDGLSLSMEEGELKSLLGPSGCGKTTTLRCIAGLERPDSGEIYLRDQLISAPEQGIHLPPQQRDISLVFQSFALWPHMTVQENVRFPLDYEEPKVSKQEKRERVDDVLEMVGILEYKDNLPGNLSGGQQQRVSLARSLVVEPDLMLLDEPLSNLDAKLRWEMREEIRRICREAGITMLYVTHSQDEALFLSNSIAIMRDGKLVEEGTPEKLHTDPDTLFAMNFLGRTNEVLGRISDVEGDLVTIDTDLGPLKSSTLRDGLAVGDDVNVMIRPKDCRLEPDHSIVVEEANVIEGILDDRRMTTDFFEYEVEVGDNMWQVRMDTHVDVDVGDTVEIYINLDSVKLYSPEPAGVPEESPEPEVPV